MEDANNNKKCRPSELPLYPPPISTVTKVKQNELSELEKLIIEPVGVIRKAVSGVLEEGKIVYCKTAVVTQDATKNFNFIINYLREEDHEAQRYGAVAMGTITGYIFGLRSNFIKRITYSLLGTGVMAAICFPEQTNEYLKQGKLVSKIAYNFIYGVKPGDPQPEINLPNLEIPKSTDDFMHLVSDLGNTIKNLALPAKHNSPDTAQNTKD